MVKTCKKNNMENKENKVDFLEQCISLFESVACKETYQMQEGIKAVVKFVQDNNTTDALGSIINSFPTDIESHDAVMELRKELKEKNKDENLADINGWLMGINWCKQFMLSNAYNKQKISEISLESE